MLSVGEAGAVVVGTEVAVAVGTASVGAVC